MGRNRLNHSDFSIPATRLDAASWGASRIDVTARVYYNILSLLKQFAHSSGVNKCSPSNLAIWLRTSEFARV